MGLKGDDGFIEQKVAQPLMTPPGAQQSIIPVVQSSPLRPLTKTDLVPHVPGVALLRQALTAEEQKNVMDIVWRKGGLKDVDGNWNFIAGRGRHFCGLDKYQAQDRNYLCTIAHKMKVLAESTDTTLKFAPVTHLLTLAYPDTNGLGWHVDDYGGNNGDVGAPVYSLTLGNSCVFSYAPLGQEQKVHAKLESGDLIVFGGPQREMPHAVDHVIRDVGDVRLNLTFRTWTEGFSESEEARYQTEPYRARMQAKWATHKNAKQKP